MDQKITLPPLNAFIGAFVKVRETQTQVGVRVLLDKDFHLVLFLAWQEL